MYKEIRKRLLYFFLNKCIVAASMQWRTKIFPLFITLIFLTTLFTNLRISLQIFVKIFVKKNEYLML